jgi:hypothetical protein
MNHNPILSENMKKCQKIKEWDQDDFSATDDNEEYETKKV